MFFLFLNFDKRIEIFPDNVKRINFDNQKIMEEIFEIISNVNRCESDGEHLLKILINSSSNFLALNQLEFMQETKM